MRYAAAAALLLAALAALVHLAPAPGGGAVPSTAAARPTPHFSLPRLSDPARTLSDADLRDGVTLLNVWATWCAPCRQEHEVLLAIAREPGVRIVGLNFRDRRDDALRWLSQLGNPYVAVGHDGDGEAARALGVAGAPETYVIDAAGRIAHRHLGPLSLEVWRATLSPLVAALRDEHAS